METSREFDVVIMGGGIGGSFQARHLLLSVPGIRVAVVEPQSAEELARIAKIGESTVEIAGSFMVKDLGLGAYLTEHHLPKNGLNFHWPKKGEKTDSMDDYWSVWALRQPVGHAWQVHRGKLEVDLLQMNREHGVEVIEASVVDFDISPGSELNQVHIETRSGERSTLSCKHLVDAAGRAFLTGRKFNNISRKPRDKYGIKNGTAWVRVGGVDRDLFHNELDQNDTSTVRYYGTNHFFGPGHWLWMIPLSRESMELSIGVIHHHDVVPARSLNSREKFLEFLKANHEVLYRLVSTAEDIDFVYWGSPSHVPSQVFSEDNWSALGDAIYFGDAFYSVGISALCVTVDCTTELIRAQLANEPDLSAKRGAFNRYIHWFATTNAHTYRDHPVMLGNASIMSWRIYFEYLWWFGALVPGFVGKWHLEPAFIEEQLANCPRHIHGEIYDELSMLARKGTNIGLMDCYRADQLPLCGDFYPDRHHVPYLENTEYGHRELNIYRSVAATHYVAAMWWLKLQARVYGPLFLFRWRFHKVFAQLLKQSALIRVRSWVHERENARHRATRRFALLQKAFSAYRAPTALQAWPGLTLEEEKREARVQRGEASRTSGSVAVEPSVHVLH